MTSTRRAAFAFTWAAVLLALAAWGVALAMKGRGGDLAIYLRAAQRFADGAPIYLASDGKMPFKYPPAAAWLFLPLAQLPQRLAAALMNAGSVAALALTARLCGSWLAPASERASQAALLATAGLFPSIFYVLFYGQVDAYVLALLVASAVSAERGRSAVSGLCLALAAALKLPALLLALLLLARRRYRALALAALFGAVLWVPVIARYGASDSLDLAAAWRDVLATTTPPWASGYGSQGLPTLLLALTLGVIEVPSSRAILMAQLAGLLLFLTPIALVRPPPRLAAALLIFGAVLLSPLAWRANFILGWPLLYVGLADPRPPARWYHAGIAALFFAAGLATSKDLVGAGVEMQVLLLRPFTAAALLLFAGALVFARREGAPPDQLTAPPRFGTRAVGGPTPDR